MKKINFSYNWNNKLDCNSYTTIRLANKTKYKRGEVYQINLKDKKHHEAKILGITSVQSIYHISEFIARIDTGYSAREAIGIIEKMYSKKRLNLRTQPFYVILLEKKK